RVTGMVTFNKMHMAQVSAQARGRVEAIEVAPGQHVQAGQRLAVLDYFDLGALHSRVTSAQAAVAQAQADDANAKTALTRGEGEVGTGGLAKSELDRRRTAAVSADAVLRTRLAELQYQEEEERRLMPTGPQMGDDGDRALVEQGPTDSRGAIISPLDGVVDTIDASPGEIVDVMRPVFTVADLSTVMVRADVPAAELSAVREGESITVRVDAYPGRTFTGHVVHIANQLDPRTGTASVLCAVPNPDSTLRVNMFGTVEIASPVGHEAVLVPDAALQDVNGQKAIFVPDGTGRFVWRAVRTGISSGGFTEVDQGVTAGTIVVDDGSFWLKAVLLRSTIPDEG
ncbi:MAG TPA: efflux RND transporter periplasmic adaptor subunit, partial [Pseudolabrys sp.]|nr:efflux RND transporter periplasmic adaptor subunit [Pseudolabrys sp.]